MIQHRRETVRAELEYAPWVCTVTDSPTNTNAPPIVPATATPPPASLTLGFLTIVDDSSGVLGGYLLTNSWGRPLEFRLSTAVQPNRVQQILYGPTLTEYLHADLIGKTLIEKTSTRPGLIITDSIPALALRHHFDVPVLALPSMGYEPTSEYRLLHHDRCSRAMITTHQLAAQLHDYLERIDPAVDLAEPFARIREAVAEARKMGVTSRAA
jgi:hypothetical protein